MWDSEEDQEENLLSIRCGATGARWVRGAIHMPRMPDA